MRYQVVLFREEHRKESAGEQSSSVVFLISRVKPSGNCPTCGSKAIHQNRPTRQADERGIEHLAAQGKTAVIPPKRNRKQPRNHDWEWFKAQHLIENFFAKLKQYRAIAPRYDKRSVNFVRSD